MNGIKKRAHSKEHLKYQRKLEKSALPIFYLLPRILKDKQRIQINFL